MKVEILTEHPFVKMVKWTATRVLVFYLFLFLASCLVVDYSKLMVKAKAGSLSRLMPPHYYDYLRELEKDRKAFDQAEVEDYRHYFEQVVRFLPYKTAAYGMVGFCYYHLDQHDKALAAFKTGLLRNPHFFTFQHNRGVVHFKKGEYAKAVKALEEAVVTKMSDYMIFISSSRLFFPLSMDPDMDAAVHLKERLRDGFRDAYVLLVLSHYQLKDYPQMLRYATVATSSALRYQGFFYHYAGVASYHLQDYQQAVFFFRESAKFNDTFPDTYYYMGLALKQMGQEPMAVRFLAQATALREQTYRPMPSGEDIHVRIY